MVGLVKQKLYNIGIIIMLVCWLPSLTLATSIQVGPGVETEDIEILTIAIDKDFAPYSSYDDEGAFVGADVELLDALGKEIGKTIVICPMAWSEARVAVEQNEVDMIMGLDYRPYVLPKIEMTIPLHRDPYVAFSTITIKQTSDLYDKRIAVLEGSNSYPAVIEPNQLEANTEVYKTYSEAFEAIESGAVDVCIATYSVGISTLKQLGMTEVKASGPQLASSSLCIGMSPSTRDLVDIVNEGIFTLMKEGTIDEINDKWLSTYVEEPTLKTYIQNHTILKIGRESCRERVYVLV